MENFNNVNFSDASLYVACLQSYNEGDLVGEWLKLDDYSNAQEFLEAVQEVIEGEEWAIHDYEYIPKHFYSEYLGEKDIQQIYDFFEKLEEKGSETGLQDQYLAYFEYQNLTGTEADFESFENSYIGTFEDGLEGYAWEYVQEMELSELGKRYFDYKSFENDLNCEGYYEIDNAVFQPY